MTAIVGDRPDNWIPGSAEEWYEWLFREEEATVRAYREKPSNLIADYHRERAIARDYEGREILELLQNANDQASEIGQPGRVLIEISKEALIVANTGLAFSVGGVASLQTSHLSPKRHRRQHFIGNKGLGFRSVLNWSKTPIIMSKALCLAYCTEHAKDKLKALTWIFTPTICDNRRSPLRSEAGFLLQLPEALSIIRANPSWKLALTDIRSYK